MSNNQAEKRFTRVTIPVGKVRTSPWSERTLYTDGLLFETAPDEKVDVGSIVSDPKVTELLGGLLVIDNDERLTVHGELRALPTPDKARPDTTVHYVSGGSLKSFKILQRFSECTDPVRDLLGCAECSNKGLPCISGRAHGAVDSELLSAIESTATEGFSTLKDNNTRLAGYRYVSPVLLAEESETFVKGARQAEDIDWSAEEGRRGLRRAAANSAALTRHFKKTECANCLAREAGCTRWNGCSGAYEPAEHQYKKALEKWLPVFDGTPAKGGLQMWQLYAIMHRGGDGGVKRWHRRHVVLGGLVSVNDKLVVRVAAQKKPADHNFMQTEDWARLREVFPELPEKDGDKWTHRPSDKTLALYFAAVETRYFAPVLRGFQGYQTDNIGFIATWGTDSVWVERARNWGIRPGVGGWSGVRLDDWVDFYKAFHTLPGARRVTRPEVYRY